MRELCLYAVKAAMIGTLFVTLSLSTQGQRIEKRCGALGYYDTNNKLVKNPLIIAPLVDGTRISDEWGWRLHPVLNHLAFHFGVDIAAPRGTPIHAVADGVIVEAKRKGISGLYVLIRHSRALDTGYAHVSAFAPGIHPGVHVTRGQVIAFIGSTGLSTGPHLHFEIFVHGSRVRPACGCKSSVLAASSHSSVNGPALLSKSHVQNHSPSTTTRKDTL